MNRGNLPCTVITYVRNGGPLFEKCVQSALVCREHVVLDGGSTDGTREVAQKYGCTLFEQDKKFLDQNGRIIDFGGIASQAYHAGKEEWVAFLSADEEFSEDFIKAITKVIAENKRGVYLIDRFFVVDGRVMKYFSTKHNRQIRFCSRESILDFVKPVHERPVLAPGVKPQVLEGGYQYLPLEETPEELKKKYTRYLDLDKDRITRIGWLKWIKFASKRVAIMVMLLTRMIWIRIIHDPKDCMPLDHELLNIWYGWQLIKRSFPLAKVKTGVSP